MKTMTEHVYTINYIYVSIVPKGTTQKGKTSKSNPSLENLSEMVMCYQLTTYTVDPGFLLGQCVKVPIFFLDENNSKI